MSNFKTIDGNIEIKHKNHHWVIPVNVDVMFEQLCDESIDGPADWDIHVRYLNSIGYFKDERDHDLLFNLVDAAIDNGSFINFEECV